MAGGPLDELCPVDWRGEAFFEGLARLSEHLQVPYIIDPTVSPQALAQPVRFSAARLNGSQAVRWLCRSVGLEAAYRDGVFLVAGSERLPASWRVGGGPGGPGLAADVRRIQSARERRVDIDWVDVPLSRVATDLAAGFGLDLIPHPRITEDQPLVHLAGQSMTFEVVCRELEKQLNARLLLVDGAVWCRPGGLAGDTVVDLDELGITGTQGLPSSGPKAASLGTSPADVPVARPARITVDDAIGNWDQLAELIETAAGSGLRWEGATARFPSMAAHGNVAELLEGLRLLGAVRVTPAPAAGGGQLLVRVQSGP